MEVLKEKIVKEYRTVCDICGHDCVDRGVHIKTRRQCSDYGMDICMDCMGNVVFPMLEEKFNINIKTLTQYGNDSDHR